MAAKQIHKDFAEVAALPDHMIRLDEAALLLAKDEYPDLDISTFLRQLDTHASAIAELMPRDADPWKQVDAINDYLFRQRHFRGNVESYYDPRNSYLNEVLERRAGIPITLSIVYIEIARRLKIPIHGVNLPGHFVVRYLQPGVDLFIDPFNAGRLLSAHDCQDMMLSIFKSTFSSFRDFLEPVSARVVLTRMLNNLKIIFLNQNDAKRTVRVLNRLIQLNPKTALEYKERGMLLFAAHQHRAALCDLMHYLQNAPNPPDESEIHRQIELILMEMHHIA